MTKIPSLINMAFRRFLSALRSCLMSNKNWYHGSSVKGEVYVGKMLWNSKEKRLLSLQRIGKLPVNVTSDYHAMSHFSRNLTKIT